MTSTRSPSNVIPTIYFVLDFKPTLDTIWELQNLEFACFRIDNNLTQFNKNKMFLLQYDIPKNLQNKISTLYHQTNHSLSTEKMTFGSSKIMPPSKIINFEYFSGYWEYINNPTTGESTKQFFPCKRAFKIEYLEEKKTLSNDYLETAIQIEKKEYHQKLNLILGGVSLAIGLTAYALDSPLMCLASSLFLFTQATSFSENLNSQFNLRKKAKILENNGGLLALSVFSSQKEPVYDPAISQRRQNGPR